MFVHADVSVSACMLVCVCVHVCVCCMQLVHTADTCCCPQRLMDDAERCRKRMAAASALINGLSGERIRWTEQSKEFKEQIVRQGMGV